MGAATTADFDPTAERLLSEGRDRQRSLIAGRERLVRLLAALGFLVIAVPLAVLEPQTRHPSLFLFCALIGAFAVASRIEFEVGSGGTVPTELVMVPMLFLLPVGLVPAAVAA